ncbi:MAG: DUF433 domain-containing protein [Candidatus Lokiarchaeota archaeon]|nr:DUF433 domain-containing protein [Candidatus Lokiarchaeota archaeon]
MVQIIESNQQILGGKPVIKGTRMPVDLIFELVGADEYIDQILEDYPSLTRDIVEKVIDVGVSGKKHQG